MNWLSGGVLFAVGAALWVAYLLPSMLRRRHVQQAEFEAARLQHALHMLAETGELPADEPSTLEQLRERKHNDKLERQIEKENLKALHEAEHARKEAAKQARAEARRSEAARRTSLKRVRTFASWLLLGSLLTVLGGGVAVFFGVTWMVAGAGAMGATVAVVTLRSVVRGLAALSPVTAPAQASADVFEPIEVPVPAPSKRWTPTPLPSPLHLADGSQAAATIASNDAVEALRRRAREVAAETSVPAVPTVNAARARAAARAAHPATYGAERRRAMLGQTPASASTSARPLSPAEQAAARTASLDALAGIDEAAFDVREVLQRRRAS